jgi:hypothetical protein
MGTAAPSGITAVDGPAVSRLWANDTPLPQQNASCQPGLVRLDL